MFLMFLGTFNSTTQKCIKISCLTLNHQILTEFFFYLKTTFYQKIKCPMLAITYAKKIFPRFPLWCIFGRTSIWFHQSTLLSAIWSLVDWFNTGIQIAFTNWCQRGKRKQIKQNKWQWSISWDVLKFGQLDVW